MSVLPDSAASFILDIYRQGKFPMGDTRDDDGFYLIEPEKRGVISLNNAHISRSLRRFMRKDIYDIRVNHDFPTIIENCAGYGTPHLIAREDSWITQDIIMIFNELHDNGHAHSVEIYDKDGVLQGGLYGLALGAVFFAESMFSKRPNYSKMALVHLISLLWDADYKILDVQFLNPHLLQFGAYELDQSIYKQHLNQAINATPTNDFSHYAVKTSDELKTIFWNYVHKT